MRGGVIRRARKGRRVATEEENAYVRWALEEGLLVLSNGLAHRAPQLVVRDLAPERLYDAKGGLVPCDNCWKQVDGDEIVFTLESPYGCPEGAKRPPSMHLGPLLGWTLYSRCAACQDTRVRA
jgi:hypothetical protein